MLPLVASLLTSLAENGLGLLSSALQAKGKEAVENVLGVRIPDSPTAEDISKLRQLQFDHEERLLELGVEKAKQDLETFKTEVQDKGSARDRDTWFIKMGQHNWRADFMFLMAVVIVAGLVWIVWKDSTLDEYVKGIFTLVLGRFLGYLDNIYSFEFGTTRGSQSKDATIKNLSGGSQ